MSPTPSAATLPLSQLPPGAVRQVIVEGEPVAVCNVDGRIYAIHDQCTHVGVPLSDGPLEGHELMCTFHGAIFDVRTGVPICGPATEPCRRYTVTVEGEMVRIDARRPAPPPPDELRR